ncbi:hypothetical protein Pfo_026548 [Paulownia fortunei]|nr:hypothetical protein Pfo_026548 [Paulownia fortunei]
MNVLQNLQDFHCVGSSHGWLAFLDEAANPFLLNPFSRTRIHLPEIRPSQEALHQIPNYAVIVTYSVPGQTKLAFCRHGDEEWSDLEGKAETYYDVVCCDQINMVFALGPGPSVEAWDLNETIPKKTMMIQDSCPRKLARANQTFPSDLYSSQWYLALSCGQMFLVVRYIGEFVRYDGEVPLVCPYKTVEFHVFKFAADQKNWIEVESLNDFALFLGGNQSIMMSTKEHAELKGNAIYFTDDYWDRMDEDYSYGGHDMGIFKLEDGSIEPVLDCQEQRIEPPPFWISLPREHQ